MNIRCRLDDYRIHPGETVDLTKRPTAVSPLYDSKPAYSAMLDDYRTELSALQSVLYAHDRYALLLIFQGMDAAGKDGAIKHVMSGVNPQGCQVYSFKQPSREDLDHDFLWRTNKCLPERGRIGIFNRSYYEEVLIVRVRPEVFAAQRIPPECINPRTIWSERCRDIVNLEDYLHRNGTRIVKFFLHLSSEEQRKRLLARIDEPDRNWKLTLDDIESRSLWPRFQEAYAQCLGLTSTLSAPWYVIPADDKRNARLIISHAIIETLKTLKMHYPEPTEQHRQELRKARRLLEPGA
ncbi:MAG: polyphosphate kinase 2 family protein [Phycisphaeraceae bacterium]|nr:polyphosphate kinase 2 family protein [Phycisphaeraceae bacterium]MCW5753155.1 polyphosphate kinase 2 family protein [Phycisphaeraceae bacterium]